MLQAHLQLRDEKCKNVELLLIFRTQKKNEGRKGEIQPSISAFHHGPPRASPERGTLILQKLEQKKSKKKMHEMFSYKVLLRGFLAKDVGSGAEKLPLTRDPPISMGNRMAALTASATYPDVISKGKEYSM